MTERNLITDAKGRTLEIRPLNVLDQVRLLRAIGPAQSSNEPYVNLVQAAAAVASIDGVPCPMPATEKQIDAAIARLDDAGMMAVMGYQMREIDAARRAAEDAMSEGEGAAPAESPLPQPAR